MNRLIKSVGLSVLATWSWIGLAQADAVTDWNEITNAAVAAGRPGAAGSTDLALVQVAVYDAVQAIDKRYEPYYAEVPGARGSRSAAAAAAAHDVLVGIYPTQAVTLDATYYNYLANNGLTGDPGLLVGQKVAAAILPLRRNPPATVVPFIGGTNPGQWRPTESFLPGPPASFSPMATPWLADSDPFTLTGHARFRVPPPPALTSDRYTRDFNEAKAYGSLTSSARTAAQTDVAYFWSENAISQWNRALRGIVGAHPQNIGENARLFALANLSIADALITAWDSKRNYFFWRPVTAIREADNDGNPNTASDPNWQPLINTPNYPDYTSGSNVIAGAMTRTLALYYGTDKFTFQITSVAPAAIQKTHTFARFSDAAQEVVNARVLLGIHFRFADEGARTQGREVAEWVFKHFLHAIDD